MPLILPRLPALVAAQFQDYKLRWLPLSQKQWSKMALQPSLLHVSALVLLVLFSSFLSHGQLAATSGVCISHDHDNTLAEKFPNNATGVLNATLAIIPIPLEAARSLIPAQYGILERAYRALLPDFPQGMYPVMMQAAHDHDVQLRAYGITLEDFSRAGFEFPFLDLSGDGYSSFRWAPAQLISATNDIAVEGSRAYGTIVSPAKYTPLCDAYKRLPNGNTYFRASSVASSEFVELEMARVSFPKFNPYPLELFKNITNQPTFANATSCDNMIRLFNTTMSVGEHAPVPVRGRIKARALPFEGETEWTNIYGVQVATPFIENNYLECESMRGYSGTGGPGDSYIPGPQSNDAL